VHSLLRLRSRRRCCSSSPAGTAMPRRSRPRRPRVTALTRRATRRPPKVHRNRRRRGTRQRVIRLALRRRRSIQPRPLRSMRRRPPPPRPHPQRQRRRPCRRRGYLHCLARATRSVGCITATRNTANVRFRVRPRSTASRTIASWACACRAAAPRSRGAGTKA
jgi:hypothetical protein